MDRRTFLTAVMGSGLSGRAAAASGSSGSWAPPAADTFDILSDNAWYLPTADQAAHLYVTEIGKGVQPVVMLHGGSGGDFNYLVDAIRPATENHRFVLFDQRGSALSPVADAAVKTITIDVLVEDIETLRIALQQPKLVLLGHSFGTLLALSYYQKHPETVAGLILTASFPSFTPEGGMDAVLKEARAHTRALMARPEVAALLKREGLDGDPKAMTSRQRSARNRIVGFADFDLVHVERWRRLQGGGVFYNRAVDDAVGDSIPAHLDFRTTMAAHPVPIALIQGDQDYLDPAASTWRGTTASIHVIKDAGHVAWIDNPTAFQTALRESLAKLNV